MLRLKISSCPSKILLRPGQQHSSTRTSLHHSEQFHILFQHFWTCDQAQDTDQVSHQGVKGEDRQDDPERRWTGNCYREACFQLAALAGLYVQVFD